MQDEARSKAVEELAERLLETATRQYEAAPKLVLNAMDPSPPPLTWHVAFTSAQLCELLMRLCVMRGVEATTPEKSRPKGFAAMLQRCRDEANRAMRAYGIELAQRI